MPRLLQCCPGCALQYDVSALDVGAAVRCSCGASFGVAAPRAIAARAICCSRCGGRLADGERRCAYCESEVTLEERRLDSICPACFGRMAGDARFCTSCGVRIEPQPLAPLPASARCPRCADSSAPLRSRRVGASTLVECRACGGLWVDPSLLERLCDDREARQSVAEALGEGSLGAAVPRPSGASRAYIPCPTCGQPMNRKNFGTISGVLIDLCKHHGVWLDHGELARVLEFAGRGGLVEARRREVRELERKKERADSALPSLELERERSSASLEWRGGGLLGWLARELLG